MSLAFSPNYAANGNCYVSYYDPNGVFKVSRFTVSGNPDRADAGSEKVIGVNYPLGCHGGQLVFASDGTLFLNLTGPIANTGDGNALAGKMRALLNENGDSLPVYSGTNRPFSQFFAAADCSVVGGAFAGGSDIRMDGVFFYGDAKGIICGLKFDGLEWVKYNLAAPTVSRYQTPVGAQSLGVDNGDECPSNSLPATSTGPLSNISTTPQVAKTITRATGPPFIIAAFGRDEKGRVYVANYGTTHGGWEPSDAATKKEADGEIYLIQDDLLQFEVRKTVQGNSVTLAWQSAPGIKYRIQSAGESNHWADIRPEMVGTGWVLSVANLPNNPRISYRVMAITPIKT